MSKKELVPQDVTVKLVSFSKLANEKSPLALDSYQRAYVWGEDKIIQLLNDFSEFIHTNNSAKQYYMGTLLLHQKVGIKQKKHFVIDGQQRLTSLSVLYWLLHRKLPAHIQFEFRSSRSLVNIQQAKCTMQAWFKEQKIDKDAFTKVFKQLRFTVIAVQREDLAFTFFDTQNNRGVPLSSTDLLKAYHLRAIQDGNLKLVEQLQSHCARRWEQVQLQGELGKTSQHNDFAPELFHYYLWRGRNWTGNQVVELESKDEMLKHFGDHSKKAMIGEVALYCGGTNQWGKSLTLTTTNDYSLTPAKQHIGQQAAYLPFALRQPISQGVGFFLYAEKYASMLNVLFHQPSDSPEVLALQGFYNDVVSTLSAYLQSLFRLAVLTYFDRLGSEGLLRFAIWLDHRLGAIRLTQADIRRETPLKFLRNAKQNLLDVLAHAYDIDDVIRFLRQEDVSKAYATNDGWKKQIKSNRLVQERYACAVAGYFNLGDLRNKTNRHVESTITNKLNQVSAEKLGVQQGARHV
jgi:hypothetical protein